MNFHWKQSCASLCALISFGVLTVIASSAEAQTLQNPGFETPGKALISAADTTSGKAQISGVIAQGWQDNASWADVTLAYSLDSARPHSGKFCQKIEIKKNFAQFIQPVRLTAGRYRAAIWMRSDAPLWVSLNIREAGAPYAMYGTYPAKIGPTWAKMEVSARVSEAVDADLMIITSGTGTLYLDDAEFAPTSLTPHTLHPPKEPVPAAYFGLNINHMHDKVAIPWPTVPFGYYRTWDSGIVWAGIEPKKGVYDWANLDKDVAEAEKHGVKVLLTLGFTPLWASSDPTRPGPYGPGFCAPPKDIQDWKDFIRAVAARYKGRIAAYETWNEPDLAGFYTGTPAQLAALEKAAREALKEANSSALLVAAGPSGGTGLGAFAFIDAYLDAGGGKYSDVMAQHLYNGVPEDDLTALYVYRKMLSVHGLGGKRVWNTESGWDYEGKGGKPEETAAFTGRAYILNWAAGVRQFDWYSWNEISAMGVRPDADGKFTVLTPPAVAYAEISKWLTGAKMLSCASDAGGTWICALLLPDKSPAWILWNTEGAPDFALPAAWGVTTRRDLTGNAAPLTGGKISLSAAPVLLTASKAR